MIGGAEIFQYFLKKLSHLCLGVITTEISQKIDACEVFVDPSLWNRHPFTSIPIEMRDPTKERPAGIDYIRRFYDFSTSRNHPEFQYLDLLKKILDEGIVLLEEELIPYHPL